MVPAWPSTSRALDLLSLGKKSSDAARVKLRLDREINADEDDDHEIDHAIEQLHARHGGCCTYRLGTNAGEFGHHGVAARLSLHKVGYGFAVFWKIGDKLPCLLDHARGHEIGSGTKRQQQQKKESRQAPRSRHSRLLRDEIRTVAEEDCEQHTAEDHKQHVTDGSE